MFNTYNAGDTNLKINACSGGIYKTYRESWFERFNLRSTYSDNILQEYSVCHYKNSDKYYKVVVLQVVICGEMEAIAEIIRKEDFDKYFEKEKVEERN